MRRSDLHRSIDGFEHIVNRQRGDTGAGEGFHFDAGLSRRRAGDATDQLRGRGRLRRFAFLGGLFLGPLKVDFRGLDRDRVTEGDQVGRPLGRCDGGQPGDRQHIAFAAGSLPHQFGGLGIHRDPRRGGGDAFGDVFGGDVDHVDVAIGVEVVGRHFLSFKFQVPGSKGLLPMAVGAIL